MKTFTNPEELISTRENNFLDIGDHLNILNKYLTFGLKSLMDSNQNPINL